MSPPGPGRGTDWSNAFTGRRLRAVADEGMTTVHDERPGARELALVFLRISLLGFGGPNAHLALMLDEVVEKRRWIGREHFLHLVGVTNLLPGPNSSEVAIHVGYTQLGWRGALGPLVVRSLGRYGFWSMAHEARTDWSMLLGSLFLVLVGGGEVVGGREARAFGDS